MCDKNGSSELRLRHQKAISSGTKFHWMILSPCVVEVVFTTSVVAIESVKAPGQLRACFNLFGNWLHWNCDQPTGGQHLLAAETKVPLPHHVSCIALLLEQPRKHGSRYSTDGDWTLPWQEGDRCVQPSRFLWPKNAVLPPGVNWVPAAHQCRPS